MDQDAVELLDALIGREESRKSLQMLSETGIASCYQTGGNRSDVEVQNSQRNTVRNSQRNTVRDWCSRPVFAVGAQVVLPCRSQLHER